MKRSGSNSSKTEATSLTNNFQRSLLRKYYIIRINPFQVYWNPNRKEYIHMIKIIEELYNGNIDPTNKRYNQYSPYVQFAHEKNECLEKLLETLDETEKELFQKFCKAESQMQEIRQYDHFTYALKLGILLMVETYSDLDSLAG